MPNRKKPGEEKSKCGLTFKVQIEIPLSVSIPPSIADKFIQAVNNNNEDRSKILRDILFTELDIKNKKDVDDNFEKTIKKGRDDDIYLKLNTTKNNNFATIMKKGIIKYIDKYKNAG